MEDLTIIEFKVTNDTYGYPFPFIPNDSILIMIQDSKIKFAIYHNTSHSGGFPSFTHPCNPNQNKELELEVVSLVKNKYPNIFSDERSFIMTCPGNVVNKIVW